MSKKEKNLITINDKEYNVDEFTQEQMVALNHINDLGQEARQRTIYVDQLNVGREAFVNMLASSLEGQKEE